VFQIRILASTSVPFGPAAVQMQNLAEYRVDILDTWNFAFFCPAFSSSLVCENLLWYSSRYMYLVPFLSDAV
jgi:hypothetical protein